MPLKELDATPELRDDPSLRGFNDLPTLAKSYKETKAFVGNSIRPPGPDASPEARKEFYDKLVKHAPDLVPLKEGDADAEKLVWNKLGRPATKEEYDFKLPDGVSIDLNALREAAFEAGMTKAQFQKLAARTAVGAQKQTETRKTEAQALKTEWGTAYEPKLRNGAAAAAKLNMPKDVVAAILKGELDPASLKAWDSIGTALGGEPKIPGGPANNESLTPAELEARFLEVQQHPAYFSRNHAEHDVYVRKGREIMERLAASRATT